MARTDIDKVKAILAPGRDYDEDNRPSLLPFIDVAVIKSAQLVIDCGTYGLPVPDEATLTVLEGWIAAWAYKNSHLQEQSGNAGRGSMSGTGQTGMGLESNYYGQTAMDIDPTGLLQTKAKGAFATSAWTGRRPSAQTPYNQRN